MVGPVPLIIIFGSVYLTTMVGSARKIIIVGSVLLKLLLGPHL